ncbi:hypothetical protein GCM10025864_35420 [Luteimicrobium album]|uniref:Uncharacterized protein n=1 Tax=Luteimicrobium album TaxID=1054550 RepID=A0ABQ6I4U2_9MICO|nr:hypothetical protein GCM10025864_35420 [Luteimicrobium album]
MIMTAEIPPSRARVVAAFLDLGLRNAGTPLLMASTPVSAAHPDANARATRNAPPSPTRPLDRLSDVTMSKPADSAAGRPVVT